MGYLRSRDITPGAVENTNIGVSVYNNTGGSLARGKLVYLDGVDATTGNYMVSLASPALTKSLAQYVVLDTIGAGKIGRVARATTLRNVDTSSFNAAGDAAYLTTSGDWTATAPTDVSTAAQIVGRCVIKSSTVGVVRLDPGASVVTSFPQSALSENTIRYAEGSITNAEMLALRATPKTLVAAPGAGKVLEFQSVVLLFDYTAAYTETADNMAVKYENGSGAAASQTIEATGFVDATADTMTIGLAKNDQIVAKSGCENKALVLHNTGDGEYGGGNAANAIRYKVTYRIHTTGW